MVQGISIDGDTLVIDFIG